MLNAITNVHNGKAAEKPLLDVITQLIGRSDGNGRQFTAPLLREQVTNYFLHQINSVAFNGATRHFFFNYNQFIQHAGDERLFSVEQIPLTRAFKQQRPFRLSVQLTNDGFKLVNNCSYYFSYKKAAEEMYCGLPDNLKITHIETCSPDSFEHHYFIAGISKIINQITNELCQQWVTQLNQMQHILLRPERKHLSTSGWKKHLVVPQALTEKAQNTVLTQVIFEAQDRNNTSALLNLEQFTDCEEFLNEVGAENVANGISLCAINLHSSVYDNRLNRRLPQLTRHNLMLRVMEDRGVETVSTALYNVPNGLTKLADILAENGLADDEIYHQIWTALSNKNLWCNYPNDFYPTQFCAGANNHSKFLLQNVIHFVQRFQRFFNTNDQINVQIASTRHNWKNIIPVMRNLVSGQRGVLKHIHLIFVNSQLLVQLSKHQINLPLTTFSITKEVKQQLVAQRNQPTGYLRNLVAKIAAGQWNHIVPDKDILMTSDYAAAHLRGYRVDNDVLGFAKPVSVTTK